jgi:hypothetical protein
MKSLLLIYLSGIRCRLGHESTPDAGGTFAPVIWQISLWKDPERGKLCIKHDRELNLAIGMYASELRLGHRAMFLSPGTRMDAKTGRICLSRSHRDFDEVLLYLTFKEEGISALSFGDYLLSAERVKRCAALMAMALGAEIDIPSLFSGIKDVSKLGKIVEFLKREEESYHSDKGVDVARYLDSKFFILHIFLANVLSNEDLKEFYDYVYWMVARGSQWTRDILGTYFEYVAPEPLACCTRYEKNVLKTNQHMYECGYHGTHASVNFVDRGRNAVLSFLCNLLYNPESKTYSFDHTPHADGRLVEFFRRRGFKPFKFDARAAEEWDGVISGCVPDELCTKCRVGEDRIAPSLKNIFKVLNHLCGTQVDEASFHLFTILRTLKALCSYRQQVEVDLPSNHQIGGPNEIRVFLTLPENRHIEMMLSCDSIGRKRFKIKSHSCIGHEPLGDLKADNLIDFMIKTHLKVICWDADGEPTAQRLCFVGGRGVFHNYSLFAATVLDAILLCKDEGRISEIREKMHGLLSDPGLGDAFMACHRHFMGGAIGDLELDGTEEVLRTAAARKHNNLYFYILKNRKGFLVAMKEPRLLKTMRKAILLKRPDILGMLDQAMLKKGGLKTDLILKSTWSLKKSIRLSEGILRYFLDEAAEFKWKRNVYRCHGLDCRIRAQMNNFCLRLSKREGLDIEDIKKIYSLMCKICSYESEHLLIPVVRSTYERLNDMGVVYSLVLDLLNMAMGETRKRLVASLLEMILEESLCIPHSLYSMMENMLRTDPIGTWYWYREVRIRVKKLLLDVEYEGLVLEDGKLSPEDASFLCSKNAMNLGCSTAQLRSLSPAEP